MDCVDGFVLPMPRAQLNAYRALAQKAGAVWMEHGALQYFECGGDDAPPGKLTSFPQAVQLRDDRHFVVVDPIGIGVDVVERVGE